MLHQDWNNITFTTKKDKLESINKDKNLSQKKSNQNYELKAPSNLSKSIIQARNTKSLKQDDLAKTIGVSSIVYKRWESGKENPTNLEIAKLEKILGIKLPRLIKVEKHLDL